MSSPASSLFLLYSGILLLFVLNNTFPIQWPPLLLPILDSPTTIITLVALSIPFLIALYQTNNKQIDPPSTPDLTELLVMWHHPIWAFRRLKAKFYRFSSQFQTLVKHTPCSIRTIEIHIHELQTLVQTMAVRQGEILEKANIWQMNQEVINELCASADTTNQWLEQQIQLLHQEVTTLNTMTSQLAPPPVIPIPPVSPQAVPLPSPRYQPFQAWDDDRINWENLEWKEDKYCGQLARLIFKGQALAFTM
ncbi:hypothetical protein AMATHDRAFT_9209 [Amanita thiersii Skay4041]|uniref:Uncharacterized protein n=1 Tax=Amanita thiersii Skay4041 TaxID=703135 RepID=A0A2A9NB26_9AGAR|nr:hypothetical protein AMATHDRAFT_9209 [Amanita thiersii Skay4041]